MSLVKHAEPIKMRMGLKQRTSSTNRIHIVKNSAWPMHLGSDAMVNSISSFNPLTFSGIIYKVSASLYDAIAHLVLFVSSYLTILSPAVELT